MPGCHHRLWRCGSRCLRPCNRHRRFIRLACLPYPIAPVSLSLSFSGLHKWWKAHHRLNGQITEHISPYQQRVVSSFFKDLPSKLKHKIVDNWHFMPAFFGVTYYKYWLNHTYHELEREEWP